MARRKDYVYEDYYRKLGWFDRCLYKTTRDLTTSEWLEQLAVRKDIYSFLLCWQKNRKLTLGTFNIDSLLMLLMHTPIINVSKLKAGPWGLQPFSTLLGVHESSRRPEQVIMLWDKSRDPRCDFLFAISRRVLFSVDLDAPDSVLAQQFDREVKRARKSLRPQKLKPFFTERWFRIGLLPYIDISIWALRNRLTSIPDPVVARKILPEGRTGAEHVISTVTKPRAEYFLSMTCVEFCEQVRLMHSAELF